ncbi:MAG: adenine phosphoribosyltransferase [bacterium]|jgi:adenine phosphoribosyltransferase
MDLLSILRQVPDFPKPGINFIDITTLLLDPDAFRWTIDALAEPYRDKQIDKVVAIESRGFVFGAPLALTLNAGLVLVRKPNKLPAAKYSCTYDLEYGQDCVEIHQDAIRDCEKVMVLDDLLATGGTIEATLNLLKKFSCAVEGVSCVVELDFLKGRDRLNSTPVYSLVQISSE